MFTESADVYDIIYASFKNYATESTQLAELLRKVHPSCHSVLDVACGSGEHMKHLINDHGFAVDGIDLDENFVALAQRKNPAAHVWTADMTAFAVPKQYDAVICLFSSIGYARTLEGVENALRCFREQLAQGGVVVVEPWFPPGKLDPDRVGKNTAEAAGLHVERVTRIEVHGKLSRLFFDYTLTDANGVRTAHEIHELGLFTREEMLGAFERAGLEAEYEEPGLFGRGLYTARAVP